MREGERERVGDISLDAEVREGKEKDRDSGGRLEKGEAHVILAHLNPKFAERERVCVCVVG